MYPLKTALKEDSPYPLTAEQEKAIADLKELVKNLQILYVPDEAAAIAAARAWIAGLPPDGRPYEGGVDTSKIAMGGAEGQCTEKEGKLLIILYWNGTLSPAQSQWHASEQECWGLVCFKREAVKHFGRIPMVLHTDHANIVRMESLPLERIDAKHYRWYTEIVSGCCLLKYRAGAGALHQLPDALSRNPPERDFLNLARTSEWTQLKQNIRGVQKDIAEGRFDDEDPPLHKVSMEQEVAPGLIGDLRITRSGEVWHLLCLYRASTRIALQGV